MTTRDPIPPAEEQPNDTARQVDEFLAKPGAFADLLQDPETRDELLSRVSPTTLRSLLKAPVLLETIIGNPGTAKILLGDDRCRDILLDDANFLRRIAGDQRVLEQLAASPPLARKLLADERVREILLEDPNFLLRIVRDQRTLDKILDEPGLIRLILVDERGREALLGDDKLRRKLATEPRSVEEIVTDPGLVARLLDDQRFRDTLLEDRALRKRIVGDRRVLRHILEDPKLVGELLADDRAARALMQNAEFRRRVIRDPRLYAEILSDQDSFASILRDGGAGSTLLEIPVLVRDLILGRAIDLVSRDRGATRKLIQHQRLLTDADFADRMAANTNLLRVWRGLRPFLREGMEAERVFNELQTRIRHPDDVRLAVLSLLCKDNQLNLAGATLEFPQVASLWILLEEILISEEYYFPSDRARPRIIDAGTNFGLSIYYFKHIYPDARIVGFEPMPSLCELARKNCMTNDFRDVEIHQVALSGEEGEAALFAPHDDSLGASMASHAEPGSSGATLRVETQRLSPYLEQPVDFLKLDIEGAEDAVLEECRGSLGNVRHLFCEYHQDSARPSGRLARILEILEANDFDVVVGKSRSCAIRSASRPLMHARQRYSGCVWASNRRPLES